MGEPNLQEGLSIRDLALDLQLLITSSLDPKDLLALGCSCRALVETARAEPLWRWHIDDMLGEHPGLTVKRHASHSSPCPVIDACNCMRPRAIIAPRATAQTAFRCSESRPVLLAD